MKVARSGQNATDRKKEWKKYIPLNIWEPSNFFAGVFFSIIANKNLGSDLFSQGHVNYQKVISMIVCKIWQKCWQTKSRTSKSRCINIKTGIEADKLEWEQWFKLGQHSIKENYIKTMIQLTYIQWNSHNFTFPGPA